MDTLNILRYRSKDSDAWNHFVANSKNATFLFDRGFMDYHQDRFEDFSLMIYDNEELIMLLPANRVDAELFSHQGLTYGGLLFKERVDFEKWRFIFSALIEFFKTNGITSITLKQLPEFYNQEISSEFYKSLKDYKVEVLKKNIILAIDFNSNFKIHKTKVKRYKKLNTNGFTIKEGSGEFEKFWNTILISRLKEKHNAEPVHSLSEIQYLQPKFQHHIFQYCIYKGTELLAGITIFKKGHVVKSQYGMASIEGERLNALDMLFVSLIYKFRDEGMQFFSMGTVNDSSELGYSQGMLKQKQELGCQIYNQDIWKIKMND